VFPYKLKLVREYPTHKNVKDMSAFLGLASFYRRLIPKFADIAKPLTELTRNASPFLSHEQQVAIFQTLKNTLCSSDIMAYPDFTTTFILTKTLREWQYRRYFHKYKMA
jgi:hypothetical protein